MYINTYLYFSFTFSSFETYLCFVFFLLLNIFKTLIMCLSSFGGAACRIFVYSVVMLVMVFV